MGGIKKDCFSYISDNAYRGCYCLNELYCRKSECRFYQKKEEAKEKYLKTFNLETAKNIDKNIDKYFRDL